MKLDHMQTKLSADKMNKILETRFGFRIELDTLTPAKAVSIAETLDKKLVSLRNSKDYHKAENNPQYMEMMMVRESLVKWMKDYTPSNGASMSEYKSGKTSGVKMTPVRESQVVRAITEGRNRAMLTRVADLAGQGKPIPAKYMEAFVPLFKYMSQTRTLTEGEVGEAEVKLAAKDMVDTIQGMVEDIGKLLNEQLPPLVDSIREQPNLGNEKADAFKVAMSTALTNLQSAVAASREEADTAARTLSGEVAAPMAMPGTEPAPTTPMPEVPGAEVNAPDQGDEFAATDAAAGGTAPVGRERQ
jgi:hypothetical protein